MNSFVGLISFDLSVGIILASDFLLATRQRARIISLWPPLLLVVSMIAHFLLVSVWEAMGPVEFGGILLGVSFCALFGYYNLVAFSKRGVTFAILVNHAKSLKERRNDEEFIDLKLRLAEMKGNDWVTEGPDGYRLTRKGSLVVRIYRLALKILRVEAVG